MEDCFLPAAVDRIAIFRDTIDDRVVDLVMKLIDPFEDQELKKAEVFRQLAGHAEMRRSPMTGSAWQDYLLELILSSDNIFARKAETAEFTDIGQSLVTQVKFELSVLRGLYDLDVDELLGAYPPLDGFNGLADLSTTDSRVSFKKNLHDCLDWAANSDKFAGFYSANGSGEFGMYRAFRWIRESGDGYLQEVESPDPIKLSDLVEYDWQRESIRRNTEKLLRGLPSNNMLLYGDRGTGKSSSVKSMLNEFHGSKLRIIEVAKESLIDLPKILSILRKRTEKFILFLDDLSFEENETQYKALKAVLEGGLEARPSNVVLYATSNRRNLIRERFADRVSDDDVHPGDTMQEKLSLSDRFGIKVPFLAPDQEEYLRIVSALLTRDGMELTEDIRKQALVWQHSRSGRSARQFVDFVLGEKGLGS
ncbi:MAG: ATP-binding protein [Armatimonadota bacterium]